ncbi:imelysin family protein [Thiothrix nivea]|uniref:Peptidase M75, Imelysin n=1 Tax=Thiothrix nivea (strain ATCC 35100 / DSM 5205 / JP2) TaxID=870187 RepID=A0A656HCB2_THINJ|nr:imelysin family protein [Thiothrix nivea]EIJ33634.1 Peptidase M75, Imelysin [Thiothrix nivea DSM 5205]
MFKKFFLCLLLFPLPLLAETPAVAPATPLPDVDKLLAQLVDGAIIPLYRELEVAANTLEQRSKAFCAEPDAEKFRVLREGWGETLLAWHHTDALLFGPAVEEQIDFSINFNPPKKSIINGLLGGTDELTPAAIDKAGVGGQGLGTLEFLLFDRDKTEAEQLAAFQGDAGKRRCAYVQAASELLHQDISTIADGWVKDSRGYATAFRTADKGNATFASARQVVDLLVGKLYQSAEKTSKKRIGNPLGKGINLNSKGKQEILNQSNAYQLEAWRSGYSVRVVRANVEGMQRIMRDGGLFQWLREHDNSKTAKWIADAMEQRFNNYLKLPIPTTDPFTLIRNGQGKELDGYYYLGNDIQMGIKRQLAKVMRVQLGFNDNDGD